MATGDQEVCGNMYEPRGGGFVCQCKLPRGHSGMHVDGGSWGSSVGYFPVSAWWKQDVYHIHFVTSPGVCQNWWSADGSSWHNSDGTLVALEGYRITFRDGPLAQVQS